MKSSKIHFANTLNLAKKLPRETVTIVRRLSKSSTVPVIVALLLVASAQAETWTATGSMAFARRDHTATLLNNGKVLVQGFSVTTLAELYDPSSGTFTPAGTTLFSHSLYSTATRLLDGRVLIVGGWNAQQTAEIYDPATGTFSLTGNPNTVHTAHTATLLPDGRVLIAAGRDVGGPGTHAVSEIYDPATGTFSLTGSLNEHRSNHTATLLSNGKVLITGGIQTTTPGFGIHLSAAEIYDPGTGAFSLTGDMSLARAVHTATLLSNGLVLITGGNIFSDSVELYNPATGSFSPTGNLTTPRSSGIPGL